MTVFWQLKRENCEPFITICSHRPQVMEAIFYLYNINNDNMKVHKLWKQFVICTCINNDKMNWDKVIIKFFRLTNPIKLRSVCISIPSLIVWKLLKRRNARRHGGLISFHNMVLQVQALIRQMIVMGFPWIKRLPDD